MQLEANGVVGELPAGETRPPDRVFVLFKMLHSRAALILEGDNTLVRPGEIGHDDPDRLIEFALHAALLRRLCVLAEGRIRKYQWKGKTLAAKVHGHRPIQRRRHPGYRHDLQINAAKVPLLQNTHRGYVRRAWKRCENQLCLVALRFASESTSELLDRT